MTLYHVTPSRNIASILKDGLIPQVGKYAKEMGEDTPAVFLFPCMEDAQEMKAVWLEPFYGNDLVSLEVTLPNDFPLEYTGSDYEVVSLRPIPAGAIRRV